MFARSPFVPLGALALAALLCSACSGGGGADPSCQDDTCLTPPQPLCDGDTRVAFSPIGFCQDGACVYPPSTSQCAAGCADGQCIAVADPCADVVCDEPPAPSCDGAVRVSPAASGTCAPDTGACSYPPGERRSCLPGTCADGECVPPVTDPCEGVDCSSAPAASCDGEVAVSWLPDGTCVDGSCEHAVRRSDCATLGQRCERGRCVDVDPCADVVCNAPPAATCDGTTAVVPAPVGVCSPTTGECAYTTERVACATTGRYCIDGACVEATRCDVSACAELDAPSCDGTFAVRPAYSGFCVDGVCLRADGRTNCAVSGLVCADGACVTPDPCADVDCDDPPAPRCDGDERVVSAASGSCRAGVCSYAETRTACADLGLACREGECGDPCAGVTCDELPTPSCDGDFAVSYDEAGVCDLGACRFTALRRDCAAFGTTCVDGRCEDASLCDGVVCVAPPEPDCVGDEVVTWLSPGTCAGGECAYAEVRTDCAARGQFCTRGACADYDRCRGVTCISPPAPRCEGNELLVPQAPGTCVEGLCTYADDAVNCRDSGRYCSAGACVATDPCAGVACDEPPAPRCDGDQRLEFASVGLCTDGVCDYPAIATDCTADGGACVDGACVGAELCADVVCEATPGSRCEGELAVSYADPGRCLLGVCIYDERRIDCEATDRFCLAGVCVDDDPCGAVSCAVAPAGRCDGDIALQNLAPGACAYGECAWPVRPVDCSAADGYCYAGVCVPANPCAGVSCESAPPPVCDGSELVRFFAPGACTAGTCAWGELRDDCRDVPPLRCDGDVAVRGLAGGTCVEGACVSPEVREDCAARGEYCLDGVCVANDPCVGVACDDPPTPWCDGNTVRQWAASGTCTAGACSYADGASVNCLAFGAECVDGRCVQNDPCTGVICDDYPPPRCDGDTVWTARRPGVCDDGDCVYDEVPVVDCAALDAHCVAGVCEGIDPCEGVVCGPPPEPECVGTFAVIRGPSGACAGGVCEYPIELDNCGAVDFGACVDGACVVDDPCEGVVCPDPGATCLGPQQRLLATPECVGGVCGGAIEVVPCPEGTFCSEGTCYPEEMCSELLCNQVPDPVCFGDSVATYTAVGECETLLCVYPYTTFNCRSIGQACADGACVERATPTPGTVFVTEFLADPTGDDAGREWVEIANVTDQVVDAGGLIVDAGAGGSFTLPEGTFIDRTGTIVVAASITAIDRDGSTPPRFLPISWGGAGVLTLAQPAGSIRLVWDGEELDRVAYATPTWPIQTGISASLTRSGWIVGGDRSAARWCASANPYATGMLATPNTRNDECPGAVSADIGPGDVLITELLANPVELDDAVGEWIELLNVTTVTLELGGAQVRLGETVACTLPSPTRVGIGQRLVVGRSGSAAGGLADVVCSGLALDDRRGVVGLYAADIVVDEVSYDELDGWPLLAGRSASRTEGLTIDGSDPTRWCADFVPYQGADHGSPGEANVACGVHAPPCSDDGSCAARSPSCERGLSVRYLGDGLCEAGRCNLDAPRSVSACSVPGESCIAGACFGPG